jgi:hypothetical protein
VKRCKSEKDQKLQDDQRLLKAWHKWHAEQLAETLIGVHRDVFERLMVELKDLRSARELVDFIAAQDWSQVSADDRSIALHEVDSAIMKLRERNGLPSIDDPLPGQPDIAYRIIKILFESFP